MLGFSIAEHPNTLAIFYLGCIARKMRSPLPYLLILSCLSLTQINLQAETVTDVTPLINAATDFLDSIDATQKKVAQLDFDSADREDWHYIPKKRKGLAWREMKKEQKDLSWKLFRVALSESGTAKAEGVVELERLLWERSERSDFRDPEKYHVTLFGQPATGATWGASLEGHHLSINLTVIEGREVFFTPSFFGANPDKVMEGEKAALSPLKGEADEALKLLHMLNTEQRQRAIIRNKAPREIITRAKREATALPEEGLPASAMSEAQQTQLRQILSEYVDRHRAPYAKDDWHKIETAGIDHIYFSWGGSDQAGQPMYYRLQGPTFIMEYANVQNGGNHSHTVWRDFENDFGRDLLKEHLEEAH